MLFAAIGKLVHIRRIFISNGGSAAMAGLKISRWTEAAVPDADDLTPINLNTEGGSCSSVAQTDDGAGEVTLAGTEEVLWQVDLMAAGDGWVQSWPPEQFTLKSITGSHEGLCFEQPAGANITTTISVEFNEGS